MGARPRHFTNRLRDYNGTLELLPPEYIRQRCVDIVGQLLKMPMADTQGGVYIGVAGVAYALYYAAKSGHLPEHSHQLLAEAKVRVERHIADAREHAVAHVEDDVSYLIGGCGVYACGALLAAAIGDRQDGMRTCVQLLAHNITRVVQYNNAAAAAPHGGDDYLGCGSDELMVGRAGLLCAVLTLRRQLEVPVVSDDVITALCASIINSGRQYSQQHRSESPLMFAYYNVEYLGAAHGLSGILQMLISFAPNLAAVDKKAESDVKASVDWLCVVQQRNGNWPVATDEMHLHTPDREQLVHWCHGASGIVYLMAAAYIHWNERRYLDSVIRAGEFIWERGLLTKGPGICHGVAGSAYAFLLLYRLTGESKWIHRAHQFLDFVDTDEYRREARIPDAPLSLFEGLAGTLCLYVDLLRPETAEFPLVPVAGMSMCYT